VDNLYVVCLGLIVPFSSQKTREEAKEMVFPKGFPCRNGSWIVPVQVSLTLSLSVAEQTLEMTLRPAGFQSPKPPVWQNQNHLLWQCCYIHIHFSSFPSQCLSSGILIFNNSYRWMRGNYVSHFAPPNIFLSTLSLSEP